MNPRLKADALLDESGFDLLVGSTPASVLFLSGFKSVSQRVIGEPVFSICSSRAPEPYLVMPKREVDLLVESDVETAGLYLYGSTNTYRSETLSESDRRIIELQASSSYDGAIDALQAAIDELAAGDRIGIELGGVNAIRADELRNGLGESDVIDVSEELHRMRSVKSDEAIRLLRRSAEITQGAITKAMETIGPETSERDLAETFRTQVCKNGAEPLFVTVSFGDRTAHTHPTPGKRTVNEGDLVRWDAGCTFNDYASDIGRTYGYRSASPEFERTYEALYDGLEAALAVLRGGVTTENVYRAGVDAVESSGSPRFSEFEPNHIGHGIGIEVYDPPTITSSEQRIENGMVMCVEPPYNELGYGGFLIEDEVVVRNDGIDRLTEAPPSLPVVG